MESVLFCKVEKNLGDKLELDTLWLAIKKMQELKPSALVGMADPILIVTRKNCCDFQRMPARHENRGRPEQNLSTEFHQTPSFPVKGCGRPDY